MVPNLNEKEWKDLLLNDDAPPLKSLSLKLKLSSLKANIKIEKTTLAEAISELYNYCVANEKLCAKDLALIFKKN
ncbi:MULTISPECIES: hypothetical protein [unclassified Aureispira]|uniref:hypothetical protein n=1 Tax=unclassified Aureispira TaxID=2649989 RepID=UPI000697F9F7|nr:MULTISPECIES: hypothetical protein [unclassified Aureispira]WMX15197.1 hypothetical protein QP953_02285 [Aureispira sp. CCB-E]